MTSANGLKKYFDQYENIISLGQSCYAKKFTQYIKRSKETHFFDWLGTPTWAMYELIENKFNGVFSTIDDIELMKVFRRTSYVVDKNFYIKIPHDKIEIGNKELFNELKEKYTRRGERFIKMLESGTSILFIAFEENSTDRLMYAKYKPKYVIPDNEYIEKLSALLKMQYGMKFKIIFINSKKTLYDKINSILYLQTDLDKLDWRTVDKQTENLLNDNLNLLDEAFA